MYPPAMARQTLTVGLVVTLVVLALSACRGEAAVASGPRRRRRRRAPLNFLTGAPSTWSAVDLALLPSSSKRV